MKYGKVNPSRDSNFTLLDKRYQSSLYKYRQFTANPIDFFLLEIDTTRLIKSTNKTRLEHFLHPLV